MNNLFMSGKNFSINIPTILVSILISIYLLIILWKILLLIVGLKEYETTDIISNTLLRPGDSISFSNYSNPEVTITAFASSPINFQNGCKKISSRAGRINPLVKKSVNVDEDLVVKSGGKFALTINSSEEITFSIHRNRLRWIWKFVTDFVIITLIFSLPILSFLSS